MPKKRPRGQRLDDEIEVRCPYCSQAQLLVVDPATEGTLVQDCDVCCRPWEVHVSRDEDGGLVVELQRG